MPKKIVILGGGTGGVVAALSLAEAKKKFGLDYEVTVINRDEWHYMPPLWMDIALEGISLDRTRAPIRGLEKYGVNVIIGEAKSLSLANRSITMADGRIVDYDYLFITLGSRNGWEDIPGYKEAGYHNYTPEAAVELNKALRSFRGGRVLIVAPEIPYRCGIYPLEFSTVLAARLHARGIKPDITVLAPKLPEVGLDITWGLGPDIRRLWAKYIKRYGIRVVAHDGIKSVDPKARTVTTADGTQWGYDVLVKVPMPRLPRILESPEFDRDPSGRFTVARAVDFRHPRYDEVFMPGEHSLPTTGLTLAGVFVHAATHKSVQTLLRDEYGVGTVQEFPPVTCVAYVADKGFMGVCEVEFDGQMYRWSNCYNVMESYLMKMTKHAFYQGWLDRLRV